MRSFVQSQFLANFEHYPGEIKKLINTILDRGYCLTLIGGGARNYLVDGSRVDDLDFEIRFEKGLDESKWKQKLNQLKDELSQGYMLEELNYGVFRISIAGHDIEFASPRLEIYPENQKSYGHSDFTVQLICNLDYAKAFARRDFTINAVGVEIKKMDDGVLAVKLIDPLGGVKDLQEKKLNFCGENFFKDPVRFLRLIRFKLAMNFNFGDCLFNRLQEFDLAKLSKFYFFKESSKVSNVKFYREFYRLCNQHQIKYPEELKVLLDFSLNISCADSLELDEILWLAVKGGELQRRKLVALASLLKIKEKRVDELIYLKNLLLKVNADMLDSLEKINDDFPKLSQDILFQFKQLIELVGYFEKQEHYQYSFKHLDLGLKQRLQLIVKGLKDLKHNQDFIQKRSQLGPQERAIFGVYFLLKTKE